MVLKTNQTGDDSDYERDFREAAAARRDIEAAEIREINKMEDERRDAAWREFNLSLGGTARSDTGDDEFEGLPGAKEAAASSKLRHSDDCSYCLFAAPGGDLGQWLAHMCGLFSHKFDSRSLQTVSRTAAFLDDEGRRALGMFSLVGDACATLLVLDKCQGAKFSKAKSSEARAKCTSVHAMAALFAENVPQGLVHFPADVDPGSSRSGGEALEAFFGLVYVELGLSAALEFAKNVKIFGLYDFDRVVR